MVQSQFCLSWDAYKSSICNGFSSLQQNGEFVDMTLAADGHFVKVHQVLLALASPYMKELISSAPCQHPVIFLNNVSYKTLSSLLEYVYTGEVLVPSERLSQFIDTAKSLHIKGLEDLDESEKIAVKMVDNNSQVEENICHVTDTRHMPLPSQSGTGQISLPAAARKIFIKRDKSSKKGIFKSKRVSKELQETKDDNHDFSDVMDSGAQDTDDGCDAEDALNAATKTDNDPKVVSNLQYSVSIRGSLQVILNRYIYNLHSTTHRNGLRRWRCVEYRNHKCMAFLITRGNVVLNRANLHNHAFHDKKILQKIEKKAVFTALDDVEKYKEREMEREGDDNIPMEKEEYTLDLTDTIPDEMKKQWSIH